MGGVYSSSESQRVKVAGDEAPEVIVSHTSPSKTSLSSNEEKKGTGKRNDSWLRKTSDGDRNNFEDIKIPFKLLCDNGTQTDEEETAICTYVDNSVQTDETDEAHVNFTNVYLTQSSNSRCFCDISVQTDFVTISSDFCVSYSSNFSESSVQTDYVNILEVKASVDSSIQTDVNERTHTEFYESNDETLTGQLWSNYAGDTTR